ncbi:MAG: hypothetical protein AAF572_28960 [Cyanobacteria bacterium P01_B01_bin.77]
MAKLQQALSILFYPDEYESAVSMLDDLQIDRRPASPYLKLAAVRCSGGSLERLKSAIEMGNRDFRDLVMSARFCEGTNAHLKWVPRPFHKRDAEHWLAGGQIEDVNFGPNEDAWFLTTIRRKKKDAKIISLYALEPTVIYLVRYLSGKEELMAQNHLIKHESTDE